VIAASSHVNETDLRSLWTEGWNEKLKSNPLSDTLDCLAEILVLPTQETLDRMAEIAKRRESGKSSSQVHASNDLDCSGIFSW
jgi:hypothetical protein